MTSKSPGGSIVSAVQHDIASMKTRGAGEIGKAAAQALARAAKEFRGASVNEFQRELTKGASALASARPTAVSLRNGLNSVLGAAMEAPTIEEGQRRAQLAADAFGARVTDAKAAIAKLGADLIRPNETILTHCHSTAALAVLVEAQKQGKKPRVFSTETRPFRQGLITSRALKEAGVDVHLIVDSAALHVMDTQKVTKVVIGADAVDAKGGLYNKIGTRAITLAAKSLGIPVYVCAETYKFSPYTLDGDSIEIEERDPAEIVAATELPGVKIHNPVFDRTPPDQVTAYLTDRGMVLPGDVGPLIQREFGGATRWI